MPPSNCKADEDFKAAEMDNEMCVVEERLQILLKEGRSTPSDSDADELKLPEYYDARKFRMGQAVFYNNSFSMMVAKLSGLLTLLAVPSILEILVFTKQSGTACTAFRRYASTILHLFAWYEKEPSKQIQFFQSLKIVRKKHCIASRRCSEAGLRRISQLDMALTQFGFIGFSLLSSEELGVYATDEELEGFVHFWRVIGSILGMEERYNLCNGTVAECRALCRRLLDEIFLPCFAMKNKGFDEMGRILLEGLWPINPHLDPEAFTTFTLQLAVSASTNNNHSVVIDTSKLSMYSRFMLNLQLSVHRYLMPPSAWWSRFFRAYFNFQMRLAIYLTEHFPFLAYYLHGTKKSYVNIYNFQHD